MTSTKKQAIMTLTPAITLCLISGGCFAAALYYGKMANSFVWENLQKNGTLAELNCTENPLGMDDIHACRILETSSGTHAIDCSTPNCDTLNQIIDQLFNLTSDRKTAEILAYIYIGPLIGGLGLACLVVGITCFKNTITDIFANISRRLGNNNLDNGEKQALLIKDGVATESQNESSIVPKP